MAWQHLIVGLIVAGAFGHTAWALMPRAWRQALLRRAGRSRADAGSGSSACNGCDGCGPKPARARATVIRVHRR